jgi:aminoglycoside phosphotransferase (APT) family kinase protein
MDARFVHALVLEAAPFFPNVGLPAILPNVPLDLVKFDVLTQCWGGLASIISVSVPSIDSRSTVNFVAKCVRQFRYEHSSNLHSIGDARKMQSYRAEAAFYQNGHVHVLLSNGCCVPRPLLVHAEHPDSHFFVICMTRLTGSSVNSMGLDESLAALTWLARLHAIFWGKDRADAAVKNGLQEQGGYWYLDTRQIELAAMPSDGWEGRLKMAARAIDWRLKNDALLTIVHGDAKSANMLFDTHSGDDRRGFVCQMMDFQYMGRASAAKDLAYALTCACDVPEEEQSLLYHYHSELCSALRGHGATKLPLFSDLQDSLAIAYADLGRWMSGCNACPPPAADSPGFDAKTGWGWWGNPLQSKIERLVLDRFVPEPLVCIARALSDLLTQARWRCHAGFRGGLL